MSVLYIGLLAILSTTAASFRTGNRIIGGNLTTIERNPWQVSIQTFGLHTCGGIIIGPEWILTSGSCAPWLLTPFYVIVTGTNDLRQEGIRVNVSRAFVHPNYHENTNDVGLMKLVHPLTFNERIQPIKLASVEPTPNQRVNVTGFGLLHENDWFTPVNLYEVEVSIVDREKCRQDYQNVGEIDATMLCAGVPEGGKDACSGDAGGPLVANGTLVGIVSWGEGCAQSKYPGVYTNVVAVKDWITYTTGIQ